MSVEAMSGLPFQAGSAVAAAAGRSALWVVSIYMQQPLRNTALAALIGLSAMAGSNALYKQSHHHPAPLFGTFTDAPAAATKPAKAKPTKTKPVVPADRPLKLDQPVDAETTGSLGSPAKVGVATNDDVAAVQQKLVDLGLFNGTVDGLFGPRTSKAIRAFEASVGQPQKGQMTPDLIALIRGSSAPAAQPVVVETPAVTVTAKVELPTATDESLDLPVPAPLTAGTQAVVKTAAIDPQAALPTVAADTGVAVSDAAPATATASTDVSKRVVQSIQIRAQQPETQALPDLLPPVLEGEDASSDPAIVAEVQQGLSNLGFLNAPVDGVVSEDTAKAIRNFEVYFNYGPTGRITTGLVDMLKRRGADI